MNAVKAPFAHSSGARATAVGEKVHSDIKEVPTASFGGHLYAICFVDDFSRRAAVYPMKKKSEAVDKFRQYVEECAANGVFIRGIRSDNGSEYTSAEMETFCLTRKGPKGEPLPLIQSFSPPYCQSANGVSEVFWRDTFRLVRTILWDQQRGAKFWAIAMKFATTIRNHLVTVAVTEGVPGTVFTGKPVDVAHFRVPLTDCYAYVEKENRGHSDMDVPKTLDEQRRKLIFIGYASNSGCYQCLDMSTMTVYNRRYADVDFRGEPTKAPIDTTPKVCLVDDLETALELELAQAELARSKLIDSDESALTPAADAEVDGVRFVTLSEDRTVSALARLFNVDTDVYLSFLREFDGWYKSITHGGTKITAGSDVPVKVTGQYTPIQGVANPPCTTLEMPVTKVRLTRSSIVGHPAKLGSKSIVGHPAKLGSKSIVGRPAKLGSKVKRKRLSKSPSVVLKVARVSLSKKKTKRLSRQASTVGGSARPRTRSMQSAYRAIENEYEEAEQLWSEGMSLVMGTMSPQSQALASELQRAFLTSEKQGVPERTPKSHRQAKRVDEANGNQDWEKSEEAEWNGLWNAGCFADELYRGQKLHHLLWVYKIKSCGRKKSRLTLDGRFQDPSTYDDVRSPTMRLSSMRALLAIAASNSWQVFADDAQQAFINAVRPKDKPLWASYPEQFKRPGRCMLVQRYIYGLHDAPRGWFDCVRKHLVDEQHFVQSETDECLFTKTGIAVVVHVDDFLSTGTDANLAVFRQRIRDKFTMTGGPVTEYFGLDINVCTDKGVVTLSAQSYIERMLAKLEIAPRRWSTPMEVDNPLPKIAGECTDKALQKRYRQLVGSIMHPAVTCRPDVAASVRCLSQHLVHPTARHVAAATRVVQYLHSTKTLAMTYSKAGKTGFYGTCDASFNTETGAKSVTGWEFHMGGASICWKSSVQPLVTLSSCEAELVACDAAVRELRGLTKVLKDFGLKFEEPVLLAQDNMSTLSIIKSKHFSGRTKHVDLRYHHCADQQKLGLLKTVYLNTDEMTADALTKPLNASAHLRHRAVLMGHAQLKWDALDALPEINSWLSGGEMRQ
jgi:hypothetical protein